MQTDQTLPYRALAHNKRCKPPPTDGLCRALVGQADRHLSNVSRGNADMS
jgi:hypothetical protein